MHDWQKLWRHGNTLASLKLSKQIVQFTKSSPNFWQGCVDILEVAIFVLKLRSRTHDSRFQDGCCHLRFTAPQFPALAALLLHTNLNGTVCVHIYWFPHWQCVWDGGRYQHSLRPIQTAQKRWVKHYNLSNIVFIHLQLKISSYWNWIHYRCFSQKFITRNK